MKVALINGKVVTYGLSAEKALNYRKYGVYCNDDDPRLKAKPKWLRRIFG